MKIKLLTIIFGIITLLISCNKEGSKKKIEENIAEPIIEKNIEKNIEENIEIKEKKTFQFIENDSVTHFWQSELKSLTKKFPNFSTETELRKNNYDETQIDTLKILTFENSKIIVYSTSNFYAVSSAEIRNPELPIWNYIKVGMKKYQLEKTLSTPLKLDTIKVGNLEQTSLFEFNFKDGELNKIKFEGYID